MSAHVQRLQIQRGDQTQDTIREYVDENDEIAMRHILHNWLRDKRWDPALWRTPPRFYITAPNGVRLVEVYA